MPLLMTDLGSVGPSLVHAVVPMAEALTPGENRCDSWSSLDHPSARFPARLKGIGRIGGMPAFREAMPRSRLNHE